MWRRAALLLALVALASTVAGALLLAPAPARTGAPAPNNPVPAATSSAAFKLRAPKAAGVRPRAFASCAGPIRYARAHFAVTHGRPDPPVPPVSEPRTACT